MPDKRILIMAGGTGGHVYPALAVADYLKNEGYSLYWLGTDKGLESRVVPEHDYPLMTIKVSGIRGKGKVKLFLSPFMLIIALIQAIIIMLKVKPVVVLGMGGFASGPGGIAAWLIRIPLLIHEQNAIAGLTNKILSWFSKSILAAFPGAFDKSDKLIICGNPVRENIINIIPPEQRLNNIDDRPLRILVLGGSLGAAKLNEVIPQALNHLNSECDFEVMHQTGERHLDITKEHYIQANVKANILTFIDDMASAYSWSDIVICRAGALTVAELAAAGVASILIPFPYAVDDHQTKNGDYLASEDAAILIQESQLEPEKLKDILIRLYHARDQLKHMAMKARDLAKPFATESVAKRCIEVAYA